MREHRLWFTVHRWLGIALGLWFALVGITGRRGSEMLGLDAIRRLTTIDEFHRSVLLGSVGSNVVGTAGFALMASAVSGLALAIPKKRSVWARSFSCCC